MEANLSDTNENGNAVDSDNHNSIHSGKTFLVSLLFACLSFHDMPFRRRHERIDFR